MMINSTNKNPNKCNIVIATHNEDSVRFAIKR